MTLTHTHTHTHTMEWRCAAVAAASAPAACCVQRPSSPPAFPLPSCLTPGAAAPRSASAATCRAAMALPSAELLEEICVRFILTLPATELE